MKKRRNNLYICQTLHKFNNKDYCECLRSCIEYREDLLNKPFSKLRERSMEEKYNVSEATIKRDRKYFLHQLTEYIVDVRARAYRDVVLIEEKNIIWQEKYINANKIVDLKNEVIIDDFLNNYYDAKDYQDSIKMQKKYQPDDTLSYLIKDTIKLYGYDFNGDIYIYGAG